MKKIEYVWRHLLNRSLHHQAGLVRQQELAQILGLSSSTVNLALKPLRELGAVRVSKKGVEVAEAEKILYHWANHRRLLADVAVQFRVNLPITEIEGRLPGQTIPTAYTAVRELEGEAPAQYDKIYCYHPHPNVVAERFKYETGAGAANLFVLPTDPFITSPLSLAQIFVDLWGLADWYARDFVTLVKAKIDHELLP